MFFCFAFNLYFIRLLSYSTSTIFILNSFPHFQSLSSVYTKITLSSLDREISPDGSPFDTCLYDDNAMSDHVVNSAPAPFVVVGDSPLPILTSSDVEIQRVPVYSIIFAGALDWIQREVVKVFKDCSLAALPK
ncbi:unnamed protein product [Vicia faba]|uniref:Uncharacterized protein n=1 Tax=Vicia faba TaxID=3906 RepID=A0AAV0YI74_VICFA|nr:unnamed protein product [Vicia faba]